MKRNLLTTTALIALLSSAAVAEDNSTLGTNLNVDASTSVETDGGDIDAGTNIDAGTADDAGTNVDASAQVETDTDSTETMTNDAATNAAINEGHMEDNISATMSGEAVLASNLIGKKVYSSASTDAEVYGDINDVVMDDSGNTEWVIVGVGGFLGMGEKEVALTVEQIDWVERDGERIVITNMTQADLEAAAEFNRDALVGDENFNDGNFSWTDEGKNRLEQIKTWDWEHAQLETVADADISADALISTRVYGPNREELGEVGDVLLTDQGEITAYIVDVGGFLGIGEKPVALSKSRIHIYQNGEGELSVRTDFTQEQLENGPTYNKDEYANDPNANTLM